MYCDVFWANVYKTVRPVVSHRRPVLSVQSVSLSVTFVHCGQTVGRIKIKLAMQVGFVPGHIVLDGDPAPPHQRGSAPPNFRPISIVVKRLDAPRYHLVRMYASAQGTLC